MKTDTMATRLIDSSAAHQRFIRKAGILYGVNVALGFTLFFWLPDALALRELHYAGWWMKLVLGLALVTPLSAALGWLAASLRWAGLSVLAWMAGGGMLAWIGGHVQFEGMSWLMRLTDIYPSEQVMYPFTLAATAYTGLSAFVGVGVGLFIGTFGLLVLERAWEASTQRHGFSFKSLVILGACLPALLGLGLIADFQINVHTRGALTSIYRTIETARDPNADLASARVIPLTRYRAQMSPNYTLYWNTNDEDFVHYSIDIQFDTGLMLRCSVLFDNASFCSELSSKLDTWMTQLLTWEDWTCTNCGLRIDDTVRQWLKATIPTLGKLEAVNLLTHHGGWLYMRATFDNDRKIDCRFSGDQPIQVDLCTEPK